MDINIQIMKALSDETRLKMIDMLLHHDYCVGALAYHIGLSEASISQHLKVLRKAGLVRGEKRGYYTHYEINIPLIEEAAGALMSMVHDQPERQGCKLELTGNADECRVLCKKR